MHGGRRWCSVRASRLVGTNGLYSMAALSRPALFVGGCSDEGELVTIVVVNYSGCKPPPTLCKESFPMHVFPFICWYIYIYIYI